MVKTRFWLIGLVLISAAVAQTWQTGPVSGFMYTRFDGEYFPGTNKVYFLGGRLADASTSGVIWSYDPVAQTYANTGAVMPKPISNYDICLLQDNYNLMAGDTYGLYIVGGRLGVSPNNNTDSLQIYYPRSNTARVLPTDPFPGRAGGVIPSAMACIVRENKMYVYGGFNATSYTLSNQTWVFDPLASAGSRWTQLGNISTVRAYIIAAAVDSFIYAIGGDTFDGTNLLPRRYCQKLNTRNAGAGWSNFTLIPKTIDESRAYGFDSGSPYGYAQKIIIAGRGCWAAESAECFIYNAASDVWSTFPSLNQARRNHAGAFIPGSAGSNGVPGIWVWGGRQGSDSNILTISEFIQLTMTSIGDNLGYGKHSAMAIAPNPSRGAVTVRYSLPTREPVALRVFDVRGGTVAADQSDNGCFMLKELPVGVYLVRLEAKGYTEEQKLVVVK